MRKDTSPRSFRFPPDLAAALDKQAAAEECPTSVIVFRSLRAALGVPVPPSSPTKAPE